MSIAQLKTRGRALRISKWCRTRRTNFIGAHADKMPLCSSFQYGGLQSLPIDTLLRKRSTESVPSVPSVWKCCAKLICIRKVWEVTLKIKRWSKGWHGESNLRHSNSALRCYIDSTVIEVYYEFGEEILLKLNFDQNDSVTYREEAGLTFQIIMLNSFRRILIILPHDELI